MGFSWKYRPRKREQVIFAVWALLLAAVVLKTAVERMAQDFRRVDSEIALRQTRLEKLTRLCAQADEINAGYARILKNEKMKDAGILIREIENTARKAGVNMISLKPFQLKEANQPETQAIKVELQDRLPSIVRFFSLINEELSGIGIERVQVQVQTPDELPRAAFVITTVPGG